MIYYKSKYGHAKRYAEALGKRTGLDVKDLASWTEDPNPVIVTGVYAGGLNGAKQIGKAVAKAEGMPVVVICGLADPNEENTRTAAKKAVEGLGNCEVFVVRGGIDYKKLSFVHRIMMWMLYQSVKRNPDFEDNGFLETYGKQVDFFEEAWLEPVEAAIEKQGDQAR